MSEQRCLWLQIKHSLFNRAFSFLSVLSCSFGSFIKWISTRNPKLVYSSKQGRSKSRSCLNVDVSDRYRYTTCILQVHAFVWIWIRGNSQFKRTAQGAYQKIIFGFELNFFPLFELLTSSELALRLSKRASTMLMVRLT